MILAPTVLVLGAGASHAYGFPLGADLTRLIDEGLQLPDPKNSLRQVLRECGFSNDEIHRFHDQLLGLGTETVDRFLEHQPQFVKVGRAAIAGILGPLEEANRLRPVKYDWYRLLLNQLLDKGTYRPSQLTVLTFNYDRSLEEAIYGRLQQGLRMSESDAASAVKSTYLLHLHGQLGPLPWWRDACPGEPRPYDKTCSPAQVRGCADQLLIVGDAKLDEERTFEDAHAALRKAQVICFLGFGYHDDSMRRLGIGEFAKGRQVYGTAMGLGERRREALSRMVPNIDLGGASERIDDFLERTGVLELPPRKPSPPVTAARPRQGGPNDWMGN